MRILFVLIFVAVVAVGCVRGIEAPMLDNGLFCDATSSRLTWDPVMYARHYEIEFGADPVFGPGKQTRRYSTRNNSILLSNKLPYNKHYYWRVRAISWKRERSIWSNTGHLLLRLATPEPIGPSAEISEINPAIHWAKVLGAAVYEVEISLDDETFTNVIKRYSTAAKDYFPRPITVEKSRVYFWRVRGITEDGYTSIWSEPMSFRLPGQIARGATWPRKGVSVDSLTPTLSWTGPPLVLKYQVELIYARDLGNTEYEAILRKIIKAKDGRCVYTLVKSLAPGLGYAWRVRPLIEDGPGEWSEYNKFRTRAS